MRAPTLAGYLTIAQAAAKIERTEGRIRQQIAAGNLPTTVILGRHLIREKDLAKIAGLKRGRKPKSTSRVP